MFPIAYSIVEQENKDSWAWFLNLLMTNLGIDTGRGWTFISDRHKGLVQVLGELLLDAEHRFCVRHMFNNFSKKTQRGSS